VNGTKARSGLRTLLGLLATLSLMAAFAMPVLGASVTPTPISDDKNPTCSQFGPWTELKVENPGNGTFSDGTLSVTISSFVQSSSGTPGSFNWSSNVGVDAVLVKAGDDKHNLYVYNPESTGDTGLSPQAGSGNGISHISFCYDAGGSTPPPAATTPPPAATTPPPAATSTPGGGVAGGNPTPTPAPLPNTALGGASSAPVIGLGFLLIGSIGALAYVRLARQPR
jgi:hypothetical protein